jgi:mercuric ion binding protein
MKHTLVSLVAAAAAAISITSPAHAAPKTVTLAVPSMEGPVCPITVKKSLDKVPGVTATQVDFDKREAAVTFDDVKANVEQLTQATGNAG